MVVVGGGVVDLGLGAVQNSVNHGNALLSQQTGVLVDGHGLHTGNDVLGGHQLGVLTGDQGPVVLGVAGAFQSGAAAISEAVESGGADVQILVSIEAGQVVLTSLLSFFLRPTQDAGLLEGGHAGLADQGALIQVGLQDLHQAVVQQNSVVVVGGAHEELNSVGLGGVGQILGLLDVLADCPANAFVIEGSVVGNSVGVHQQTVVSDDGDAGGLSLSLNAGQSAGVDGGNNQNVNLLGDHVLNLRNLSLNVVLSVLQFNIEALGFQLSLHVAAVLDPTLRGLGGHCDADGLAGAGVLSGSSGSLGSSRGLSGSGSLGLGAAGGQRQNHHRSQDKCNHLLH